MELNVLVDVTRGTVWHVTVFSAPRSLAEMAATTSVHVVSIIELMINHASWFFPEGKTTIDWSSVPNLVSFLAVYCLDQWFSTRGSGPTRFQGDLKKYIRRPANIVFDRGGPWSQKGWELLVYIISDTDILSPLAGHNGRYFEECW